MKKSFSLTLLEISTLYSIVAITIVKVQVLSKFLPVVSLHIQKMCFLLSDSQIVRSSAKVCTLILERRSNFLSRTSM